MVLDTSAIVAAIANEADGTSFQQAMLGAASLIIWSVTVLEAKIVLQSRYGDEAVREFDEKTLASVWCRLMQQWRRRSFAPFCDTARAEATRRNSISSIVPLMR